MSKEIKNRNSIIDQLMERPIPYYNNFLPMKGYKPYEILQAEDSPKDRYILKQHLDRHYGRTERNRNDR